MYIYRIVKKWDDHDAKSFFELQRFQPYDPNHSCYSCYDSWKRERRKCSQNGPRWDRVSEGDRDWAARTIKQYKILPNMLMVETDNGVISYEVKVTNA